MTNKNQLKLIALSMILVLTITGCTKKDDKTGQNSEAEDAKVETVFAVNAFESYIGDLNGYLDFGGDVTALSSIDVLPDTSGRISRILVNVGDVVKKDQILAEVDASRPGMTYSASPVKSPIDGTVTAFTTSVGSMASPSMTIGKVSSTDKLEIKTSVAERYISKIKLNQKAVLTFDAYPGETFSANVVEISPVLDTSTRTMSISLQLNPPDERVKIGMYSRIKLITDHKSNVVIVPINSVITRSEKQYVFVVNEDNSVSMKEISEGIRVDDKVEILQGLTGKEIVVTKGQTLLNEGTKVNVVSLAKQEN